MQMLSRHCTYHCHNNKGWIMRSRMRSERGDTWPRPPGRSWVEGGVRRWRLQIYEKVAARTRQQLNTDGPRCEPALSLVGWKLGTDLRAPELFFLIYGGARSNISENPEVVAAPLARARDPQGNTAHVHQLSHSASLIVYLQKGLILLCLMPSSISIYVEIHKKLNEK